MEDSANSREPQKSGWPLTEAEARYVSLPESARAPGADQKLFLPALFPVTPSAGHWEDGSWLEAHTKLVAVVKANAGPIDILLVGDSLLEQWGSPLGGAPLNEAWQKSFGRYKTVNLGIGGDKTQNVLWRLDHGAVDGLQPRLVILLIGNNNADFAADTGIAPIAEGIRLCAHGLRERLPQAHLLVLKLLPCQQPGSAVYESVRKVNAALDKLNLASDPKIQVLDLFHAMVDPDGRLKRGVFQADRIHLTESAGYSLFASQLKPAVDQLLQPPADAPGSGRR